MKPRLVRQKSALCEELGPALLSAVTSQSSLVPLPTRIACLQEVTAELTTVSPSADWIRPSVWGKPGAAWREVRSSWLAGVEALLFSTAEEALADEDGRWFDAVFPIMLEFCLTTGKLSSYLKAVKILASAHGRTMSQPGATAAKAHLTELAKGLSPPPLPWECTVCSYENDPVASECDMCASAAPIVETVSLVESRPFYHSYRFLANEILHYLAELGGAAGPPSYVPVQPGEDLVSSFVLDTSHLFFSEATALLELLMAALSAGGSAAPPVRGSSGDSGGEDDDDGGGGGGGGGRAMWRDDRNFCLGTCAELGRAITRCMLQLQTDPPSARARPIKPLLLALQYLLSVLTPADDPWGPITSATVAVASMVGPHALLKLAEWGKTMPTLVQQLLDAYAVRVKDAVPSKDDPALFRATAISLQHFAVSESVAVRRSGLACLLQFARSRDPPSSEGQHVAATAILGSGTAAVVAAALSKWVYAATQAPPTPADTACIEKALGLLLFSAAHDAARGDPDRLRYNDHVVYCARTATTLQPELCQLALRLFGVLAAGVDAAANTNLATHAAARGGNWSLFKSDAALQGLVMVLQNRHPALVTPVSALLRLALFGSEMPVPGKPGTPWTAVPATALHIHVREEATLVARIPAPSSGFFKSGHVLHCYRPTPAPGTPAVSLGDFVLRDDMLAVRGRTVPPLLRCLVFESALERAGVIAAAAAAADAAASAASAAGAGAGASDGGPDGAAGGLPSPPAGVDPLRSVFAPPVGYDLVTRLPSATKGQEVCVYAPQPPAGFVAVGVVFQEGPTGDTSLPSPSAVACVARSLVSDAASSAGVGAVPGTGLGISQEMVASRGKPTASVFHTNGVERSATAGAAPGAFCVRLGVESRLSILSLAPEYRQFPQRCMEAVVGALVDTSSGGLLPKDVATIEAHTHLMAAVVRKFSGVAPPPAATVGVLLAFCVDRIKTAGVASVMPVAASVLTLVWAQLMPELMWDATAEYRRRLSSSVPAVGVHRAFVNFLVASLSAHATNLAVQEAACCLLGGLALSSTDLSSDATPLEMSSALFTAVFQAVQLFPRSALVQRYGVVTLSMLFDRLDKPQRLLMRAFAKAAHRMVSDATDLADDAAVRQVRFAAGAGKAPATGAGLGVGLGGSKAALKELQSVLDRCKVGWF